MKKPTLEEVKEYFKDAKSIKAVFGINEYHIDTENLGIFETETGFRQNRCFTSNELLLWDTVKGYAKILTYKNTEPKFEITKEQIIILNTDGNKDVRKCMREWFPDVFEVKLEVGKWYKCNHTDCQIHENKSLIFVSDISGKSTDGFGFDFNGKWFDKKRNCGTISKSYRLATPQEVETDLKNEAVKRYKEGDYLVRKFDKNLGDVIINKEIYCIDSEYYYNAQEDYLEFHGFVVYSKGQWATVLETKTIKEAEELLNCKII